jgi:hypothetical protein
MADSFFFAIFWLTLKRTNGKFDYFRGIAKKLQATSGWLPDEAGR